MKAIIERHFDAVNDVSFKDFGFDSKAATNYIHRKYKELLDDLDAPVRFIRGEKWYVLVDARGNLYYLYIQHGNEKKSLPENIESILKRKSGTTMWYPYRNGYEPTGEYKYLVLVEENEGSDFRIKKADYGECLWDECFEGTCTDFYEYRVGAGGQNYRIKNVIGYIPIPFYDERGFDIFN